MKNFVACAVLGGIALLIGCGGGGSNGDNPKGTLSLQSIAVSLGTSSVPLGTIQQLTAMGTLSDNSTQDLTTAVTWSTSQPGVVSISKSGKVTATGIGTSDVTATFKGVTGSTPVTVSTANVISMKILPGDSAIATGTKQQLAALVTFDDGSTLNVTTTAGINWSTSDSSIATIGGNDGFASSAGAGQAVISATFGTVTASTKLTVSNVNLKAIAISPGNGRLPPGVKQRYTAVGTFSDGSTQNISTIVTWNSDSPSVATISNNPSTVGLATAIAGGLANISASFQGKTGSTPLNVSNATLSSISVDTASDLSTGIAMKELVQFTATGNFSDGSHAPLTLAGTWSSSNGTAATINDSGLLTGLKGGATDVTVSFNGVMSAPTRVNVNPSPIMTLNIQCVGSSFAVSTSQPCVAQGTLADASVRNMTPVVHWTSSDTRVGTISNTLGLRGNITGVSPGNTTITAYLGGVVGFTNISVSNAYLTTIKVSPANQGISLGGTLVLKALGVFDDGTEQDLGSEPAYLLQLEGDDRPFVYDIIFVNWTSDDPGVAVVNKAGIATSTGVGATKVNATLNGVSGNVNLQVH